MYSQSTIKLQISKHQDSQEKEKKKRERRTKKEATRSGNDFVKIIFRSLDAITEISKHRAQSDRNQTESNLE